MRRAVAGLLSLVVIWAPARAAAAADEPEFPRPGGGPRVIEAYNDGRAYLLDRVGGTYQALPYIRAVVSPDGRQVAAEDQDGRISVLDRRGGSVRPTSLPPGSFAGWSPDGSALLTTTLDKETRTFTAHRYDVRTGRARQTPIALDCVACTAGWAADSRRYVVMQRGPEELNGRGPLRYLNPDGTAGPLVGADGVIIAATAYSPSRRFVVVEPPYPLPPGDPIERHPARILDLRTGAVTELVSGWPLLGWYDECHVVRIAPGEPSTMLEVVDARTGAVAKRVPAPGLAPFELQLGSARGLHGSAAERGF
jgi:hypothetical protein